MATPLVMRSTRWTCCAKAHRCASCSKNSTFELGQVADMNNRASPLWRCIHEGDFKTLAVMGMRKNTGKTVALNHLLAQAAAAKLQVGVSSIGRDGEERDQVFLVPKPPVLVWPGTLVATARATLQRAKVCVKLIDTTDITSPMGEIVVVKIGRAHV